MHQDWQLCWLERSFVVLGWHFYARWGSEAVPWNEKPLDNCASIVRVRYWHLCTSKVIEAAANDDKRVLYDAGAYNCRLRNNHAFRIADINSNSNPVASGFPLVTTSYWTKDIKLQSAFVAFTNVAWGVLSIADWYSTSHSHTQIGKIARQRLVGDPYL